MNQRFFRIWFLVTKVDLLPISACYARNVVDAKELFRSQVGYIVPYSALGDKVKVWADNEFANCPCYEKAKKKGFAESNIKRHVLKLPIAGIVTV